MSITRGQVEMESASQTSVNVSVVGNLERRLCDELINKIMAFGEREDARTNWEQSIHLHNRNPRGSKSITPVSRKRGVFVMIAT